MPWNAIRGCMGSIRSRSVDRPKLCLDLRLEHDDGSETVVKSDETWQWSLGPIRRAWICEPDSDFRVKSGRGTRSRSSMGQPAAWSRSGNRRPASWNASAPCRWPSRKTPGPTRSTANSRASSRFGHPVRRERRSNLPRIRRGWARASSRLSAGVSRQQARGGWRQTDPETSHRHVTASVRSRPEARLFPEAGLLLTLHDSWNGPYDVVLGAGASAVDLFQSRERWRCGHEEWI